MLETLQSSVNSHFQRISRMKFLVFIFIFPVMFFVNSIYAQTSGEKSPIIQQKTLTESLIEGTEIIIKVVAVKDNAVSSTEYLKPGEGNKFVSVQVIIDNTKSTEDWEVKPETFRLKDVEGNVYEPKGGALGIYEITAPGLKSGVVDGGDFVKGWIAFEVADSINVKQSKFRHENYGFTSESIVKSGWINLSAVIK